MDTNSDRFNIENLHKGHRQRIKQRLLDYGQDVFVEYEKLELFLTLCIPRKDVKDLAKLLLNRFGSINEVINAKDSELLEFEGINNGVLCNIKILRMCIESYYAKELKSEPISLENVSGIAKYFEKRLAHLEYEVLEMICLDSQLRLIGNSAIRIFDGNINSVEIDIRKILEIAIKNSASSIVIAHNHPTAPAVASKEDIEFTKALSNACKTIKLDFIEHIIIAKGKYFSFRNNAYMDILYDSSIENYKTKSIRVANTKKTLKD